MVADVNDITFEELLNEMIEGSDGHAFLEAILTGTALPVDLLGGELQPSELIAQLCQGAVIAQQVKNNDDGLEAPNRISAYAQNGLGSLRQDGEGKRYVQESYTVTVRNYVDHDLVAENS